MRLPAALLTAILVLLLPLAALAGGRHALVVGIDAYVHVTPLQKARNDARAVGAALEGLGFGVTTLIDPDRRELNQALSSFAAGLEPGDEALFYFAGHGIEVAGRNYLLPADIPAARPGDEEFVIGEAIGVDRVLATLQRRNVRVSLLILDACRDNPFPTEGARSLGGTSGLARVSPPEGAFILFSAGTGQAALDRLSDDDPDPNSVFTRALLPRLAEPGLDILSLTQKVRSDVRALARTVNHDQFPAYYDQLTGVFTFHPAGLRAPEAVAPPAETPPADPCAGALQVWSVLAESESPPALRSFAETYRDSCAPLAELAAMRAEALGAAAPRTEVAAPEPEAAAPRRVTEPGIAEFLEAHLRAWSSDAATAMARIRQDYAERVVFYGNDWTREDVLRDKRSFVQRWPQRDYRLEAGSLASSCDAAGRRCEASYVLRWEARSPERNARSRGRSVVELTLERREGGLVILRESGRTLERF